MYVLNYVKVNRCKVILNCLYISFLNWIFLQNFCPWVSHTECFCMQLFITTMFPQRKKCTCLPTIWILQHLSHSVCSQTYLSFHSRKYLKILRCIKLGLEWQCPVIRRCQNCVPVCFIFWHNLNLFKKQWEILIQKYKLTVGWFTQQSDYIFLRIKNFTGKTMNTVLCKLISREEKRKKIMESQWLMHFP